MSRKYLRGREARSYMRGMLASQGIFLDGPVDEVDRDEVRRILAAAGAPSSELERLVDECPSVEWARAYRPPTRTGDR